MPNYSRDSGKSEDDLVVASRIMETVTKQLESYRASLEKLRELRKECELDESLYERIKSPTAMTEVLMERGIPLQLAVGMAAEDFQDPDFGGALALWTWDCCCTDCCLTNYCLITAIRPRPDRLVVAVVEADLLPESGEREPLRVLGQR